MDIYRRWFIIIFLLNLLASSLFFILLPETAPALVEEDLLLEDLSAILFLLAGIYFLYVLVRGNYIIAKSVLFFLIGFCFLCFLEEIGFGERIHKLPMPEVGGGKIDGFHDIFSAIYLKAKQFSNYIITILFIFLLTFCGWVFWKWLKKFEKIREKIILNNVYFFLFLSLTLIATATILDVGFINSPFLELIEELFEMNAGLALLFGAVSLRTQSTKVAEIHHQ